MKKNFTWIILLAMVIFWATLIALAIKFPLAMLIIVIVIWGCIFYGIRHAKLIPPNAQM